MLEEGDLLVLGMSSRSLIAGLRLCLAESVLRVCTYRMRAKAHSASQTGIYCQAEASSKAGKGGIYGVLPYRYDGALRTAAGIMRLGCITCMSGCEER